MPIITLLAILASSLSSHTDLFEAVEKGRSQLVLAELRRRPLIGELKEGDVTLFCWAIFHRSFSIYSKMISMDRNLMRVGNGNYPVHYASRNPDPKILPDILRRGYSANQRDLNGFTPLTYAVTSGQLWAVKRLLSAGANASLATDNDGRTLLWSAIGRPTMIHLLKNRGVDINARTKAGRTLLIELCDQLSYNKAEFHVICNLTTQELLSLGADVEIKDKSGLSAFDYARRSGNTELQHLLLENAHRKRTVGRP